MERMIVQHLHTDKSGRKPLPENIMYGELAINYAANDETLFIKNSESAITEFKDDKYYQKQLSEKTDKTLSLTYSELVSLRDNSQLIPGQQYRITDYTCTTTQENTRSAGHPFDIIVTADDESTLNEEARAIKHEGDAYFANSDLNAWQIWYCLDNDTNRFAWAIDGELIDTIKPGGSSSGTYTYSSPISKIVFMGKAYNLEIGVRTMLYSGPPVYITKTDDYTLVVEDDTSWTSYKGGISVYTDSQEGKGVIYRMIDEFGNDCPYDFKNIQFKHPKDTTTYPYYYYTFANHNAEDNTDNSLSISDNCYSNTIREYISNNKRLLNFIIFIGHSCYNNSFGNYCYSNTFGTNYNSYCHLNTFGSYCYKNTFGNDCEGNIFGNGCQYNTFGDNCQHNTFGNYCARNTFGNGCDSNTFGNYFVENTFGNHCYYNTFGNHCSGNRFGNNCGCNTFGNCCQYIKFASDVSASNKYNYCQNNYFGDGCAFIIFKGEETASSSAQVQNYNFAQGLQGTYSSYLTINGVRNRSFETKVEKNSNGNLKIFCLADLIYSEGDNSEPSQPSYPYSTYFIGDI